MAERDEFHWVGCSPAFKRALECIRRYAPTEATVLVQGETGTGKELAARALHYLSARRAYPFVPVNCGAIPDSLFESEFYGYERGAFTDAREPHGGLVGQAKGGTLFLDEVECLSSRAQGALLRFLQDRSFRAVGGRSEQVADVRIVAASNVDLGQIARSGQFRHDLLFRLNLLTVSMPPLRERPGDAILLAESFLARLARQYRSGERRLDSASLARLASHSWPGNVRELETVIHRAFLLSEGEVVTLDLERQPAAATDGPRCAEDSFRQAKARAVAAFERSYITQLLARARGNISLAAKLSGKERRALGKLIKKHEIDSTEFR